MGALNLRRRMELGCAPDLSFRRYRKRRNSSKNWNLRRNLPETAALALWAFAPDAPMKRSVLIVDDEPLLLELFADMLKDMDCDVWTARHGHEALQVLERNAHIGVLLSDVHMPGMSGHELAERARRLRDGLRVLLLSGRESDGHGYPIVRKPFVRQELQAAMSRTVGVC
jgi:CheY-like chemotaxis protein